MKVSALLAIYLLGASAFASPGFDPIVSKTYSKRQALSSAYSLRLPRYEQWKKLSPQAQRQFIETIQKILLQADVEARNGNQASVSNDLQMLKKLYDLWLETAEAKTKGRSSGTQQPYCINQGVVKPIANCDTSLGYQMHNFDTNEVLSQLGEASKCPAGEKPCSPFFGFTSDGQMICSSKNLTRDCAQKSKEAGTIPVADVLLSCEAGAPGVPKVDCKALGSFFDQQIKLVENLCQNAPKRYACSILKDQIQDVMAEYQEKKQASANVGLDKVADVVKATNDAAQMDPSTAPCPTEPKAPAPQAAPAAPKKPANASQKNECPHKALAKDPETPTFDSYIDELMAGQKEDFICGVLDLPNKGMIGIMRSKGLFVVKASADAKPVALNFVEAQVISSVSQMLLEAPYKVAPKDLPSHFLPKEAIKDPSKITLTAKDGKTKKDFPTQGWVTSDGTRIRYIPGVNFGDDKGAAILVGIQPPGGKEEQVTVAVSLPDAGPEDPKADPKAAKPQPK